MNIGAANSGRKHLGDMREVRPNLVSTPQVLGVIRFRDDFPAVRSHLPVPSRHTRHVCAFFNSDEEEYRVLIPFIKDGFNANYGESSPSELL